MIGIVGGYMFVWPFTLAVLAFFSLVGDIDKATEPPAE
jgi:hypothetical protein